MRAIHSPDELMSAGLWHEHRDGHYQAFHETNERPRAANEPGLPSLVLAAGEPQWSVNLMEEEPRSDRTRAALQCGLRAGYGFPISVGDKVIGVMEFFSQNAEPHDAEFVTMMGHVGSQLGQVIVRQRAEEDLIRAKALV